MKLFVSICMLVGCYFLSAVHAQEVNVAVVELNSLNESGVTGRVAFIPMEDGVLIVAEVRGLTPGKHGFHIHEFGDCSSADGKSAGGHYNPTDRSHGGPMDENRHMGDLGNLVADKDGNAYMEVMDFALDYSRITGKSVIVHQDPDDYKSQPSGAAGKRVACGVIKLLK